MSNTVYLPLVMGSDQGLKHLFARHGIRFGMAGEHDAFDSSVSGPIIRDNCAIMTSEVSLKTEYTQPTLGTWDFSYFDKLVAKCQAANILIHGHCGLWHMQNPGWLRILFDTSTMAIDDRYTLMERHICHLLDHCKDVCYSMDLVNEFMPAYSINTGWGRFIGLDAARYAFTYANNLKGSCKLFYNSFFPDDEDASFAVEMLRWADGIGVQLHLRAYADNSEIFTRVDQIARMCQAAGKVMRLSEISVIGSDDQQVADTYRMIAQFALMYPGVITDVVTWGVKGKAWNNGNLLFDNQGQPTLAYHAIVEELKDNLW